MDNITLPSWSGLGLAYDIAVSADPSDPLAPLYARVRRQREEELLISVLVDWEYIEDAFDAPEICRWVDECAEPETSEPAPPAWLLAQWAEEDRARHSVRERDHWGDPFPTLGEPTEDELLPALPPLPVEQGKKRSRRRATGAPPSGCLLLTAHLAAKDGHYPDAVVDNNKKRRRDSRDLLARLERLAALYPDGLKLYRLTLGELDDRCLYDPETVELAKKTVRTWLRARGLRGEWKLERGRCGGTHVHIVTSVAADSGGREVCNLDGLARYLVKPADARACMVKKDEKPHYSPAELKRQKDEAAEDWLRAEAMLKAGQFGKREKLPRMLGPMTP